MRCQLENMVAHWGWCCSAGCRYVSIMHGFSSRFLESQQVNTQVIETNPAFVPPFVVTARIAAA